jgi:hypothetical protein
LIKVIVSQQPFEWETWVQHFWGFGLHTDYLFFGDLFFWIWIGGKRKSEFMEKIKVKMGDGRIIK